MMTNRGLMANTRSPYSFAKVVPTGLVRVSVDRIPDGDFIMNEKSVKLRTIVDGRER